QPLAITLPRNQQSSVDLRGKLPFTCNLGAFHRTCSHDTHHYACVFRWWHTTACNASPHVVKALVCGRRWLSAASDGITAAVKWFSCSGGRASWRRCPVFSASQLRGFAPIPVRRMRNSHLTSPLHNL